MTYKKYSILDRLIMWLKGHTPVWCARCGRVIWSKDARAARLTTGAIVLICETCRMELYGPEQGDPRAQEIKY